MKILALDLATHTGWAHSDGPSGTWNLSVRRDESGGMRLVRLRGKLREVQACLGVELLVFEAPRHAGPGIQAVFVQGEMQGVVKLWCEEQGINYRGYSPSEIKKFATSKGNASKAEMLAAARAKWPETRIDSEDQADALHLLALAQYELEGGTGCTGSRSSSA